MTTATNPSTFTLATVNFQVEGWHGWKDAPDQRAYLRESHRHLFKIAASIEVFHDDREIEFHDLLDFCNSITPRGKLNNQSCEQIAESLLQSLLDKYGVNRKSVIKVFEDGEVGAELSYVPPKSAALHV